MNSRSDTKGRLYVACFVAAHMVWAMEAAQAVPTYTMTKLDTFATSGGYTRGVCINELGQIAGTYTGKTAEGEHYGRAFLWDPTTGMQELGTLGGAYSWGEGLNDAGQVVGRSYTADGSEHAFIWDAVNGMQDLGTLGGDRDQSWATGITNSGDVVGFSDAVGGVRHGFTWDTVNGMLDMGIVESTTPIDINDSGQVVGASLSGVPGSMAQAFLWDAADGLVGLGVLSSDNSLVSSASAINEVGQVTGMSDTGEGDPALGTGRVDRAFLWDPVNGMQDLGSLGGFNRSWGHGLNDSGWVVGESDAGAAGTGTSHAFLHDGTQMWDLNDLIVGDRPYGFQYFYEAWGINNSGQIVVTDSSSGYAGYGSTYLLTPGAEYVPPPPSPGVPEPASMTLIVLGLSGMVARRLRKK